MPEIALDHVSVRTSNLDASIRFYEDVIGLKVGYRPTMSFGGAWLYDGSRAVIHIICEDEFTQNDTGPLDHVAFNCKGLEEYRQGLDDKGVPYRTNYIPDTKLTQLFVEDPEGVTIELNFFQT
jgi:catechol 2,3-dioxygenase-like lactoylglutathione lyase family enzyme